MTFVSVVIPAKNEFPQVIWTIYSIAEAMPSNVDYELILVNDASTDKTATFWGDPPLSYRGLLGSKRLRIVNIDPSNITVGGKTGVGCWRARTKGFEVVSNKSDITFFADAHIVVHGNTLQRLIEIIQGGDVNLLHVPVATLGDDTIRPYMAYSYKLELQHRFWGEYTNRRLRETPYAVAMGGFALCGGPTKYLRELGLWHDGFRGSYCGGEQYIDLKTWLLGGKVWIDPQSLVFHSSITRGYCFTNECMWHNILMACYCVAGEEWMNMVFHNMGIEKYGKVVNMPWIMELGKSDREDILKRAKWSTFDDMLKENPWEFPIKGSRFTNTNDLSLPDLLK